MQTQTAAANQEVLTEWQPGLWRFRLPHGAPLIAGVTDRSGNLESLRTQVAFARGFVQAEQVHRTSLTAIDSPNPPVNPIPGCDGLTTRLPGLMLVIRTADCLPIVVWDPIQQVIGLAHVGWRGLASRLPMRLMSFLRHVYHSRPADLWVGIGPSIRACCYEVGKEFEERFGSFVTEMNGRLRCDLIGCATQQLLATGVRPSRLLDCGQCTACHPTRWYSVRRDGTTCGRLLSFVVIRP